MPKRIAIKLISIGHLPIMFRKEKIKKLNSTIFSIIDNNIESYTLTAKADGFDWEFTDENIKKHLPYCKDYDLRIVIVNVPLENNYYARRLGDNTSVITFYEMKDILLSNNIPLENLLYRVIYAYSLLYLRNNNSLPDSMSYSDFTHDETRGCIYDMTGIKNEIVASTTKPNICRECEEKSKTARVSQEVIDIIKKELKEIKKNRYYIIQDLIKRHPILSIVISTIYIVIIGILTNILSTIIWDEINKLS